MTGLWTALRHRRHHNAVQLRSGRVITSRKTREFSFNAVSWISESGAESIAEFSRFVSAGASIVFFLGRNPSDRAIANASLPEYYKTLPININGKKKIYKQLMVVCQMPAPET